MTVGELRAQRLYNQRLTAPGARVETVRSLCGLQAQFEGHARHALALRCRAPLGADWGEGLVKTWTLRGTMHLIAPEDLPPFEPMPEPDAKRELLRRYFAACGPATLRDAAYWTGFAQARLRGVVRELPLGSVEIAGEPHFSLAGAGKDAPAPPDCLFLAGFDPLLLGYEKKTSVFLPPERLRGVFSLAGIVRPTVLLRGVAAATWRLDRGRLALTPLAPLPAGDRRLVERAAARQWPALAGLAWA